MNKIISLYIVQTKNPLKICANDYTTHKYDDQVMW